MDGVEACNLKFRLVTCETYFQTGLIEFKDVGEGACPSEFVRFGTSLPSLPKSLHSGWANAVVICAGLRQS